MLYLYVPYEEKEKAKSLGAKWDAKKKRWYVRDRENYHLFAKWFYKNNKYYEDTMIAMDNIYIVAGQRECWKCHKMTTVIGIGIEHYFNVFAYPGDDVEGVEEEDLIDGWDLSSNLDEEQLEGIHIGSFAYDFSNEFMDFLKKKFNLKKSYSNTVKGSYLANNCQHCNAIQGDFFLFSEFDSPFMVDSIEKAKALTLYKIPLKYDIIFTGSIGFGSSDDIISDFAKIIKFQENIDLI